MASPSAPHRALVLADDDAVAAAIGAALDGLEVRHLSSCDDLGCAAGHLPEVVYCHVDLVPPGSDSGDRIHRLKRLAPGARVVVLTPADRIREAVELVRAGADDYLTEPLTAEEVQLVADSLERSERTRSELSYLRQRVWRDEGLGGLQFPSAAMGQLLRQARQVAATRSTVLISGETGTGKSFLARLIHQHSNRADRQLISVHCGAIPDTLLESELFGHERGAFTGAERRKLGKFEIAHGGTLFLDEVATISPAMQVKLLDVLQERSIQRVGGERTIAVDVRIIAASNEDLEELSRAGRFRKDLFYRLNVFPVTVPPLRQRREDIPTLVEIFLRRLQTLHGKDITAVDPGVLRAFLAYPWPGNVRELENILERAFILESGSVIQPDTIPAEVLAAHEPAAFDLDGSLADVRQRAADLSERQYLHHHLGRHHGRIAATAEAAGITPRQLHTLMKKHGLDKRDYRTGTPGSDP